MRREAPDIDVLAGIGVKVPLHQTILIEALPCGIESVGEALEDKTSIDVNGPRAVLVVHWKGMVRAFQMLERRR